MIHVERIEAVRSREWRDVLLANCIKLAMLLFAPIVVRVLPGMPTMAFFFIGVVIGIAAQYFQTQLNAYISVRRFIAALNRANAQEEWRERNGH